MAEVKISDIKSISKQLDYKTVDWSAPDYKFSKIFPQSGTQKLIIPIGSTAETLFELPAKCFNLSQSVLTWNETIDLQAAAYSWKQMGTYGPIQQVQLYTRGGQMLADINYANVMMEVCRRRQLKLQEFLTQEQTDALYPCNSAAATNYLPVVSGGAVTNAPVGYIESKYLEASAVGTAITYQMRMRLSSLVNSIFAVDRDLAFPEVLVMRVVWSSSRVGWSSTNAADPSAGVLALTGNVTCDIVQLLLATETNNEIARQVAEVKEIMVPFVWTFRNNPGVSTAQTVTVRLNRMHGLYCKKIIHTVLNNAETTNTMYDHTNYGATTILAAKVTSYYTAKDNARIQEFDLNATINIGDDYQHVKKQLKGSCILNNKMHAINWHHCDDFQGSQSISDGVLPPNYLGGLDLSTDRKWDFVGTMINAAYNHYTFVVCTRKLTITPNAITIM